MRKGTKRLLTVVYSVVGVLLLAATLFYFLTPGIPATQVTADGRQLSGLSFPNGSYTGEAVLGFLYGQGDFTFHSGEVYQGQWSGNAMSGQGKLTCTAGVYEGQFQNGKRAGTGTFTWTDGSKYTGGWEADQLHGEGQLTTAEDFVYKGTFLEGAFHQGTITGTVSGNTFTVTVKGGSLTDRISVTFADGVTYEGDFDGKYFSGQGTMIFPGVGTYKGAFLQDQRSGKGTFIWDDGALYEGAWENDQFHGYGTYYFDEETTISGTFEHGTLDGTYIYENANGEYRSMWKDGVCTSIEAR